ncbi:MAG: hypothetical protein ACI3VK_03750 [Oscillospiraceae bacterium]
MDSQYEIKYNNLMQGLEEMHEKNVRRTRAALRCLLIIPAVILLMLFMTKGSKTIFLVLWIASMFIIAFVLIVVEYQDYLLRKMIAKSQEAATAISETAADGMAPAVSVGTADQRTDAAQQRSPDRNGIETKDFKYDNYDESAGR